MTEDPKAMEKRTRDHGGTVTCHSVCGEQGRRLTGGEWKGLPTSSCCGGIRNQLTISEGIVKEASGRAPLATGAGIGPLSVNLLATAKENYVVWVHQCISK